MKGQNWAFTYFLRQRFVQREGGGRNVLCLCYLMSQKSEGLPLLCPCCEMNFEGEKKKSFVGRRLWRLSLKRLRGKINVTNWPENSRIFLFPFKSTISNSDTGRYKILHFLPLTVARYDILVILRLRICKKFSSKSAFQWAEICKWFQINDFFKKVSFPRTLKLLRTKCT